MGQSRGVRETLGWILQGFISEEPFAEKLTLVGNRYLALLGCFCCDLKQAVAIFLQKFSEHIAPKPPEGAKLSDLLDGL